MTIKQYEKIEIVWEGFEEGKNLTIPARIEALVLGSLISILEIPRAFLFNCYDYITKGEIKEPRVFECLHSIKMYFETARSGRFSTNEEYLEKNNLKWMLKK